MLRPALQPSLEHATECAASEDMLAVRLQPVHKDVILESVEMVAAEWGLDGLMVNGHYSTSFCVSDVSHTSRISRENSRQ